jgi:hypothetical protein
LSCMRVQVVIACHSPSVSSEHVFPEIITSDMSLSPFDADELSRILELINHLRGTKSPLEPFILKYTFPENAEENDFPHSTCIIGRRSRYT